MLYLTYRCRSTIIRIICKIKLRSSTSMSILHHVYNTYVSRMEVQSLTALRQCINTNEWATEHGDFLLLRLNGYTKHSNELNCHLWENWTSCKTILRWISELQNGKSWIQKWKAIDFLSFRKSDKSQSFIVLIMSW